MGSSLPPQSPSVCQGCGHSLPALVHKAPAHRVGTPGLAFRGLLCLPRTSDPATGLLTHGVDLGGLRLPSGQPPYV